MDHTKTQQPTNVGLIHGRVVLKELMEPWYHTRRIVCVDSYFASVSTAKKLGRLGLRFIGVVNTATRRCLQRYLSEQEAPPGQSRRWWEGVVHKVQGQAPCMLLYGWTEMLCHGRPYTRIRQRQIAPVQSQLHPEQVELTIDQPKIAEVYYDTCGKIDQFNRRSNDTTYMCSKCSEKDEKHAIFDPIGVDRIVNVLLDDTQSTIWVNLK